jgi:DDE_Tnp_1-associated
MDGAATECTPFGETVVVLSHFQDPPDPRQQRKMGYPLDAILLRCLLAVLAGAECFTEIALFLASGSLISFAATARSGTARRPAIISGISSRFSMLSNSNAALSHGWPR